MTWWLWVIICLIILIVAVMMFTVISALAIASKLDREEEITITKEKNNDN